MRIAVAICSVGRPEAIRTLLPFLARQTKRPSEVVIVAHQPGDLPKDMPADPGFPVRFILSERKGLTRQRNKALAALRYCADVIWFIDDDYLPAAHAIEGIGRTFRVFPGVAGLTGHLIADGIHTGGVTPSAARGLIEDYEAAAKPQPLVLERRLVGLYGCNMAYRTEALGDAWFDERLPLYGWQEDVDFASRLPGEKMRTGAFAGVHCGMQKGRETRGHLLGYSQIANCIYLMKKGSLPRHFAVSLMARNLAANHFGLLSREGHVDRLGRLRGNWLALRDLLLGRSDPERILEL